MKDLQKIKEFFSKSVDEAVTTAYESGNPIEPQFKKGDKVTYLGHPGEITGVNKEMTGAITYNVAYDKGNGRTKVSNLSNKGGEIKPIKEGNHNAEDFKPYVVKDRNNPNFLKVFIQYPTGTGFTTALGQRTMTGQDRDYGAAKAMKIGQAVAAKLDSKYNLEDIEVSDNEAGKVIVFAVSDDFIKMNTPSIDEAEEKYTVAGRPVTLNKGKKTNGTDWTVTFLSDSSIGRKGEEIPLSDVLSLIKPFPKGITMNETKEEDAVDTITMDIPLFLRMLEYSREDAKKDLDLHDVTEKANKLGKERGILSMNDYKEIVGAAEEIDEANVTWSTLHRDNTNEKLLKQSKLSSAEYQKAKKLQGFKADNYKWNADEDLYIKVNEGELTEANVPSNIRDFAKRKGVSSLVNKVAGWAEKVGARIAGGTAVGKNYSTLVLDLDYKQQGEIRIDTDEETIELYDEPVSNFNQFARVYMYGPNWERKDLEEGAEEQLSFISKARAKSSLRQFLSGKRDDGMGKFDAIVYGIDADGNKHQIKSYNDLQNYEEFALGDNPDFVKEAKNTSLDSETIKQIKDDIKGFPKYQKRGFESFKKEVRQRYKITPKQLEDILHGDLTEGMRGELDEPFFIEVSVRDARKALDLFQDRYRNSNIDMYGSNVYAADTPEDIYDLYYDLMSQDIEILDANVEDEDFDYDSEYEKTLRETIKFIKESTPEATTEEVIAELKEIKALGEQLNEELCPAGKAYIKRRQAAGEKSSAYLSGRAVKVCKGQMSGRAKKK